MKRVLQLGILLLITTSSFGVFAQDRLVSGKVISQDDGTPLPGVNVVLKGTAIGTATDSDGKYSLSVPASGGVLVFSFIGLKTWETTIGERGSIDAYLESDATQLAEVVVTGYGTQRKEEFTGAASTVKGSTLAERPIQSFAQGLTGQATGVNIIQPNGLLNNPPVIRVRGLSSISLSSFPLIVVDGIPISTGDVSSNASTNNPLGDINPSDIESIDILKDAASAAIYGSRAAAGVLVITTKRGKAGRARVSYDGWVGVTNVVRLPEVLNAEQFIAHKNQAIANAFDVNPAFSGAPLNAFQPLEIDGKTVDTNWSDLIYRSAVSQNHNINVSGGNEKTTYYFSAGFTDQEGILAANNFQRATARVNLDHQATEWLKLIANFNYTNTMNNSPNSGSYSGGAFASSGLGRIAVAQAPNVSAYTPTGDYSLEGNAIGRGANQIAMQWSNPAVLIDLDKNSSETSRLFSNIGAEINIAEGLTFKTMYSWDFRYTENNRFWNPLNGDGYSTTGNAYNQLIRNNNWNWVNTIQYQKSFNGVHNLSFVLGTDAQKTRNTSWGAVRTNIADPFFEQFQGSYLTDASGGNAINDLAFEAYLGSVSYNYASKYFISGNFRRDGNSALSPDNRWGNFGGASVGWTVSEESFFKDNGISNNISNLRLKASWGRVGNGNLNSYYGAYNLYGTGVYGAAASTVAYSQAGNNELKWETSSQTNIGLDFGVLNDALSFEINWFNKDIDNMILAVPQAPSKGIPGNSILLNVGSMYNRGFEFAVNATPIRTNDFTWRANLNFTTLKNEVTALVGDGNPILGYTSGLELTSITQVGYSAGEIYGVRTAGVNPENGRRIFIDNQGREVQYQHQGGANAWTLLDGTPVSSSVVTSATTMLGNTQPTWYGGFNNTFTYKNFDLAVNFTYSGGNYIYNGSRAGLLDQRVWNNSTEVLNAWTPTNTNTDIPRAIYTDNVSNGSAFLIDANVERGDFLRLQTATLGYQLPSSLLLKTGITSTRFYVQANNLFLITGYTGVDPEISSNGNSNIASGIERNTIPQGRAFTLGVNIGF